MRRRGGCCQGSRSDPEGLAFTVAEPKPEFCHFRLSIPLDAEGPSDSEARNFFQWTKRYPVRFSIAGAGGIGNLKQRSKDMSDTENTNRKPDLIAYTVKDRKGEKGIWNRIGAAWENADGGGFNVSLEALPVNGRLVLRIPKPGEGEEAEAYTKVPAGE